MVVEHAKSSRLPFLKGADIWVGLTLIGMACGPAVLVAVDRAVVRAGDPRTIGEQVQLPGPVGALGSCSWLKEFRTPEGLVVGLVLGAGLAALHQRFHGAPHQPAVLWLAVVGVPLMMTDWACHHLPARLVVVLFLGGVVILGCTAISHDDPGSLARAFLATGITSVVALVTAMILPDAFGAGDVKLLGAVALYLGWVGWSLLLRGVVLALLLGATTSAALLIARRISRTDRLAFGPAVLGGALLALVAP